MYQHQELAMVDMILFLTGVLSRAKYRHGNCFIHFCQFSYLRTYLSLTLINIGILHSIFCQTSSMAVISVISPFNVTLAAAQKCWQITVVSVNLKWLFTVYSWDLTCISQLMQLLFNTSQDRLSCFCALYRDQPKSIGFLI